MKKLVKCWIYNELADIPEEYIVIEKNESMFTDLKRILERKGWIVETNSDNKQIENEKENIINNKN
jgi:hypothetical protein